MRFFDFHAHIYPDSIAAKATENVSGFYDIKAECTGTADALLKKGKKAGISQFLLLPVAVRADQVRSVNKFIISQVNLHSEFYGFATLHPDLADHESEIEFVIKNGLRGIKLHPDFQQFDIDDEKMFPVYELLQDKLPVLFHCGDTRTDRSHPQRLLKIINNFPRLKIIAAHLGGWSVFDKASELLYKKDIMFDISSCMPFLSREKIIRYIRHYGAERILFGTDFPLWSPEKEVGSFLELSLSEDEKEKIAYKNALDVLDIYSERQK